MCVQRLRDIVVSRVMVIIYSAECPLKWFLAIWQATCILLCESVYLVAERCVKLSPVLVRWINGC